MANAAVARIAGVVVAILGVGALGAVVHYVTGPSTLVVVVHGPPDTAAWLLPLDVWEDWDGGMPASANALVLAAARVEVGPDGQGTFSGREKSYVLVAECSGQRVQKQHVQPTMGGKNEVSFSCKASPDGESVLPASGRR